MKKLSIGSTVKVCEGSGLNSDKIGIVQNSKNHNQSFFKQIEPGRYNEFNHNTESLIMDQNSNYFTMFNNRLIIL